METIKEYWKTVLMVVVLVGAVWSFYDLKALGQSHDDIIKGQHQIQKENQMLISGLDRELSVMYKLGAITRDTFDDLRMLPKSPVDAEGNVNKEWYLIGDGYIYLIRVPEDCDAEVLEIPTR